jgi:hypothetical protein
MLSAIHSCEFSCSHIELFVKVEECSNSYDSSADGSDSPPASQTEEATAEQTKSQEQPLKEERSCKPRKQRRMQPN